VINYQNIEERSMSNSVSEKLYEYLPKYEHKNGRVPKKKKIISIRIVK